MPPFYVYAFDSCTHPCSHQPQFLSPQEVRSCPSTACPSRSPTHSETPLGMPMNGVLLHMPLCIWLCVLNTMPPFLLGQVSEVQNLGHGVALGLLRNAQTVFQSGLPVSLKLPPPCPPALGGLTLITGSMCVTDRCLPRPR